IWRSRRASLLQFFFYPTKTELLLSNAILPCKTVFVSHNSNNDRNDEQTLIQEQITEKMSRLCWTTLRPRPLLNCLWTHTHTPPRHLPNRLQIMFSYSSKSRSEERRVGT